MSRAYASTKHYGPSLVRSDETRATTTGRSVEWAMGTPAGANRAAGRIPLQRPSRALPIPPRTGQLPPVDHGRPRETETGNIVRRSVERTFGWLGRWRRLSRNYEELPEVPEAMVKLAMIRLMVHRLAHPSRKRLPPR